MTERRLFDLGQSVQDAVDPPDFEELRGRGRRLVRTRVIAVSFAVALVAATGVTVATSGLVDSEPPVTDAPRKGLTPEQVVQHPRAELESFAVDARDPDVRAAVWKVPCRPTEPDGCKLSGNALAVTDDGFDTATYVRLADDRPRYGQIFNLQAVGDDRFYLTPGYRAGQLVDTEGDTVPVTLTETPAPVGEDEVLLESLLLADPGTGPYLELALNVDAASAHPVDLPTRDASAEQNPDGTLWYYDDVGDARVRLSTDGGATWSSQPAPLTTGRGVQVSEVRSAANGTIALVEAAAELYVELHPWNLVRSTDNGRTWEHIEGPSIRAYWIVVRPDGSLLMQGDDGRIYSSDGTDWTKAAPVEPGLPEGVAWESPAVPYGNVESTLGDDGTHTLYAIADATVYRSTDGTHWTEIPAR